MITDLMTILREVGNTLYMFFVLPGEIVLSWLSEFSPTAAAQLNSISDKQPVLMLIVLSLLLWSLLVFAVTKMWLLLQNLFRIVASAGRTMSFRVSLAFGNFKKRLIRGLQRWIPQRTDGPVAVPQVPLDDLDVAVLQSTAACGPGLATSAPDLAEQLRHRPAQIQRSLNKLSKNMLLEDVIGSTDGFDNYRLSESGSHYVTMLRRNSGNS